MSAPTQTEQEVALLSIARFLESRALPYMVIGGMANAVWGVPRATLDVDVSVWAPPGPPEELLRAFAGPFRVLPKDPPRFVAETRVLPVETRDGVRVDVIFALLPFEEEAIQRAVVREVSGQPVRFCTAEDLVLLKIVSERPRDQEDVRQILARQAAHLDRDYLDPRVEELAFLLERPELADDYRRQLDGDSPSRGDRLLPDDDSGR